jgi:hypothetical protein
MMFRRASMALLAGAFLLVPAAPAGAAGAAVVERPVACRPMPEQPPTGEPLDGFAITRLPAGIGPLVSDFEYEWEEVAFRSRVWERGPDSSGAYRVDLDVKVLRGDRLADLASLRDFLAYYHERDPETWELTEFDHDGLPGFYSQREAFWLVQPGVAIEVTVDTERYSPRTLLRTACGVVPTEAD